MTLEELSVRFSADVSPFAAAVSQLGGLLLHAGAQADGLAGQMHGVGTQAGVGLRNGLLSQRGAVAAAARALANAAAAALRGALRIHSPSLLTCEAGRYFDEGLLQGIAGSAGRVEAEAESLGLRTAAALTRPEFTAPVEARPAPAPLPGGQREAGETPIQITVPLEVDGYRLGVAALEGINRVTRSTGRVELRM